MPRRAIIQGEIHTSRRDREKLFQRRTKETDAFLWENRTGEFESEPSVGLALFVTGNHIRRFIFTVLGAIPRARADNNGPSVEQFSETNSLGLYLIDAELHEVWGLAKPHERVAAYTGFLAFLIVSIITAIVSPSLLLPLPLLGILLSPFAFLALIVLTLGRREARDEFMSNKIVRICEREEYNEVLVLCGDNHVSGIKRRLEDAGWEVNAKRAWLTRFKRRLKHRPV